MYQDLINNYQSLLRKKIYLEEQIETAEDNTAKQKYQLHLNHIAQKIKQIERKAYSLNPKVLSYLRLLEAAVGMDDLSKEQRYHCLEFADAMVSIEGIQASPDTDKEIKLWVDGEPTYHDTCIHVLKQCIPTPTDK